MFARHVAGAVVGGRLASAAATDGVVRGAAHGIRVGVSAVLFDAFAVFDGRSVAAVAENVYPGRSAELMAAWRVRQFEYAWLRIVMRNYADFWRCTEDALRDCAGALALPLTPEQRDPLMQSYLELRPWPEVPTALQSLRSAGLRLGLLSNFTPRMLDASVRGSGLDDMFEHVLSTHQVRTYKPSPRAYQLGGDAFRLPRHRIVFAAFAGWDASGAKQFGYPTFWLNRLHAQPEELGAPIPDGIGSTATELVAFVAARAR